MENKTYKLTNVYTVERINTNTTAKFWKDLEVDCILVVTLELTKENTVWDYATNVYISAQYLDGRIEHHVSTLRQFYKNAEKFYLREMGNTSEVVDKRKNVWKPKPSNHTGL
jgi:hypothetical protein